MSLYFHSEYPSGTIWVAVMLLDQGCPGDPFRKAGWWSLTNGQTVEPISGDLEDLNRYYCFYAESSDGAVWAGPYIRTVTNNAFNQCSFDDSNTTRSVGFRLLDIDSNDDFTVNLVPANWQPPPPPPHGDHGDGWGFADGFGDGFGDGFDDGFGDGFDDGFGDG